MAFLLLPPPHYRRRAKGARRARTSAGCLDLAPHRLPPPHRECPVRRAGVLPSGAAATWAEATETVASARQQGPRRSSPPAPRSARSAEAGAALFARRRDPALRVRAWRTSARGRTALAPDRGPEGPPPAAGLRLRSRRAAQSPFQQPPGVAGPCEKQRPLRRPREHLLTSRRARLRKASPGVSQGPPPGRYRVSADSILNPEK